MLKFLINNRHQLYIYFGYFLLAVGCSRMSFSEFLHYLSINPFALAFILSVMLISGSKSQILEDLGLCIFIACLWAILTYSP